jgi:hypothetical protein
MVGGPDPPSPSAFAVAISCAQHDAVTGALRRWKRIFKRLARPVFSSRPVVRDLVDGVITVNEAEIVDAMRLCYERMKVKF